MSVKSKPVAVTKDELERVVFLLDLFVTECDLRADDTPDDIERAEVESLRNFATATIDTLTTRYVTWWGDKLDPMPPVGFGA